MPEDKDVFSTMPREQKPENSGQPRNTISVTTADAQPRGKMSVGKRIVWGVLIIIVAVALVQYLNAAKYSALVQVIKDNRIGVNPTGNALDFGDLPRDKSAIRTVKLVSNGNTDSYIMVWKLGGISDLVTVDRNNFTLKAHTTEQLQFTAYIPNSANYQYYKGQVMIFQIPKIW